MTVRDSPVEQLPVEQAAVAPATTVERLDAAEATLLGHARSPQRFDEIVMSERATAIVRAGLVAKAFVLSMLTAVYQSVELRPGLRIALDGGIYSLKAAR